MFPAKITVFFFFFFCLSTFLYDVKCCSCCVVVFLSIYKFKMLVFLLWRLVYRCVSLAVEIQGGVKAWVWIVILTND